MKKLLLSFILCFTSVTAYSQTTTKKVCSDVKDKAGNVIKNKDGTNQRTCRTVIVHKKYKGTPVQTTPPVKD